MRICLYKDLRASLPRCDYYKQTVASPHTKSVLFSVLLRAVFPQSMLNPQVCLLTFSPLKELVVFQYVFVVASFFFPWWKNMQFYFLHLSFTVVYAFYFNYLKLEIRVAVEENPDEALNISGVWFLPKQLFQICCCFLCHQPQNSDAE